MKQSFWLRENSWWREKADTLFRKAATQDDWSEINSHLWCLVGRVTRTFELTPDECEDLVQDTLLRLQDESVVNRLKEFSKPDKTPAHYVFKMMFRNVKDKNRRERQMRFGGKVECLQTKPECSPDREAEQRERDAKVRFVVNHVVSAADRQILVWHYWQYWSVARIAKELGIAQMAVYQRLFRAKNRVSKNIER